MAVGAIVAHTAPEVGVSCRSPAAGREIVVRIGHLAPEIRRRVCHVKSRCAGLEVDTEQKAPHQSMCRSGRWSCIRNSGSVVGRESHRQGHLRAIRPVHHRSCATAAGRFGLDRAACCLSLGVQKQVFQPNHLRRRRDRLSRRETASRRPASYLRVVQRDCWSRQSRETVYHHQGVRSSPFPNPRSVCNPETSMITRKRNLRPIRQLYLYSDRAGHRPRLSCPPVRCPRRRPCYSARAAARLVWSRDSWSRLRVWWWRIVWVRQVRLWSVCPTSTCRWRFVQSSICGDWTRRRGVLVTYSDCAAAIACFY
jgi:hypothetical protein